MLEFIKKLLGGGSEAAIKKLDKTAQAVEALEDEYRQADRRAAAGQDRRIQGSSGQGRNAGRSAAGGIRGHPRGR